MEKIFNYSVQDVSNYFSKANIELKQYTIKILCKKTFLLSIIFILIIGTNFLNYDMTVNKSISYINF